MRSIWAAAYLLRRLRAELGVVLMIFVLVGTTSFLLAAAPRLYNEVADDGLLHEVKSGRAVERNLSLTVRGGPPPGDNPIARLEAAGDGFLAQMPPSVQSLVTADTLTVTSIQFQVTEAEDPNYGFTFVTLRHQEGLEQAIELVGGRMPAWLGEPLPEPRYGVVDDEEPEDVPRFEIALSDRSAEATGLGLGEVISVTANGSDPLLARPFGTPLPAEFEIVGIFTVTDPDAEVWYENRTLQVIDIRGTVDNPIAYATALVAREAYGDLAASGLPFAHDWRYFIDAGRLDSGQVPDLVTDLQRMRTSPLTAPTLGAGRLVLQTGLSDLLSDYLAKRSSSAAVLSVAAIGPLVLAAGAVAMLGILLVARRRPNLTLTRSRGASAGLIIGASLWEGTLLAGTAGLLGLALATWLIPGRESPLSSLLVLGVVVASVVAFGAATWPAARRPLYDLGAAERPTDRPSARRLVLEGTAVLIAVGAIVLLDQRGLAIEAGRLTRYDPLLAATPALAGLAFGIVAMRLYPFPIRALGWLAARRRDLVPVLGLRTVGRHPSAAHLPLLVLMLTAAFGAFASVVTSTVDRGQLVASWQNLGADYRIERVARLSTAGLDPTQLSGVDAVAGAFVDPQATLATTPTQRSTLLFYAIDAPGYRQVTADAPIDPALPDAFLTSSEDPPRGTPDSPIPAILSQRLPPASQPIGPGDTFLLEVAGQEMTFVDIQERVDFPGLVRGSIFVVAPLEAVAEAYPGQRLEANQLLVRGSRDVEVPLRDLVREQLSLGQVVSRHAQYESLRDAPLVRAVVIGFTAALAVAAAYTALTVMAALTLSAAARTRDLAFLRTLGLSARQSLQLTVMEHAPPVLIALIPGVALGVAVAVLLAPSLGLAAFAGTDRELALTVDWIPIAIMAVALVAVVAVAIALSTWMSRRAAAADALRIGDD